MTKRKTLTINNKKSGNTHNELPVNEIHQAKSLLFSFKHFDRTHKLFNLGADNSQKVIESAWFLNLMDCLKDVCSIEIPDLKSGKFDLHPVDWNKSNVRRPDIEAQYEFYQFRINKSRGRVVGIKIANVFYVVWLDAHHNLTNSEGCGRAQSYHKPRSDYDKLCDQVRLLKSQNEELSKQIEKLMNDRDIMQELIK